MQPLRALLVTASIALIPAFAASAPHEIAGRYCGTAWSGGRLVEVVTTLTTGADGMLAGSYEFADKGEVTPGTLREHLKDVDGKRTLIWADKYGTGQLIVTFDDSRASFAGMWGDYSGPPSHRWDGKLCDNTVASGRT